MVDKKRLQKLQLKWFSFHCFSEQPKIFIYCTQKNKYLEKKLKRNEKKYLVKVLWLRLHNCLSEFHYVHYSRTTNVNVSNVTNVNNDFVIEIALFFCSKICLMESFSLGQESNQLHAVCQDTYPPITPPYMNQTSHAIVQLVTQYNNFHRQPKVYRELNVLISSFFLLLETFSVDGFMLS